MTTFVLAVLRNIVWPSSQSSLFDLCLMFLGRLVYAISSGLFLVFSYL